MTAMSCGLPRCARRLQAVQEVGGALRMGRGPEDGPLVVLQDREPVGDVGCVILTGRQRQFEIGAQEGCAQLGHQFFFGIAFVAPCLAPNGPNPDIRPLRDLRNPYISTLDAVAGLSRRSVCAHLPGATKSCIMRPHEDTRHPFPIRGSRFNSIPNPPPKR